MGTLGIPPPLINYMSTLALNKLRCCTCHLNIDFISYTAIFTGGTVTVGSSISLHCSYQGSLPLGSLDFSFHRGQTTLRGESSSDRYTLHNAQPSDAGNNYVCRSYVDMLFSTDTYTSAFGTVSVTSTLTCLHCTNCYSIRTHNMRIIYRTLLYCMVNVIIHMCTYVQGLI